MPRLASSAYGEIAYEEPSIVGVSERRLAVNLCDFERLSPAWRRDLGAAKLDLTQPILMDEALDKEGQPLRPDEVGVAFRCDLLTAALTCDILRDRDRIAGRTDPSATITRVYLLREKWSKVPADVMLTWLVGGVVVLNSDLFQNQMRVAAAQRGRVEL